MAILLGLDTGGTYTDAALLEEARLAEGPSALLGKAKALTTHRDLSQGIGAAIRAALGVGHVRAEDVSLVALSTTLATNALVEGQGQRAALVLIGFAEADRARGGLLDALGEDPLIAVAGGHGTSGQEATALDEAGLRAALAQLPDGIGGVAIASLFAVRNPAHEVRARQIVADVTGLPVTCSHELSNQIGGPKRALTALLNARLIGLITGLIGAATRELTEIGITAPLMVVRGDGALVSADFARMRPVETILSGPAASLVGASFLTGIRDAVVSDIGGTTTDIAVLTDGLPAIDPQGARVGGWSTMVEAVAVRTHGLGGDSQVRFGEGLRPEITLGPSRVVPVSLLARQHGAAVDRHLRAQEAAARVTEGAARFVVDADGVHPVDAISRRGEAQRALRAALRSGAAREAGFTPSDAAHVLGLHDAWDGAAARRAAALVAARKGGDGRPLATDAVALSEAVIERLVRLSAEAILEAAFAAEGSAPEMARSALSAHALDGQGRLVRTTLALHVPLIGLGASAPIYYPRIAALLGTTDATPPHADVANAVGAVTGLVRIRREVVITVPTEGLFIVQAPSGPERFTDEARAIACAQDHATTACMTAAQEAGARDAAPQITLTRSEADIEGRPALIEARVTATIAARPRTAR
ncbi:N-methylhydantoinase A/oxoprolinase/acetone carboxylase beta subunit [Rubricella aquisinus]|uniref:N-methylhydantoinase A/oxoprolinase/acetone carboxylase beta subunit n=1 Tax=Rubricella aquisinus TaxID=2028108 RepID=A0A840WQ39_9RHOB|nr:hydantoinase/oxoprolinase family protein [Rubricella aquisinus]MBB5517149.1 N-methylhydantoinase A/oxoprolinase/acetone carboxylase beta subunit [Rubricella aquisinus]